MENESKQRRDPTEDELKRGLRFREFREIMRLSQSEIAEMAEASQANISMIEKGIVSPSTRILTNIKAHIPNMHIPYVAYNEGKPLVSQLQKEVPDSAIASITAINKEHEKLISSLKERNKELKIALDEALEDKKFFKEMIRSNKSGDSVSVDKEP